MSEVVTTINPEALRAIRTLAAAYRYDWSDFDGRTLRRQLYTLVDAVESRPDASYETLCDEVDIDPSTGEWL